MRHTSAPVHARTRLSIVWERYLPPATATTASQISPIAAIETVIAATEAAADTSATPLTTTDDRSTRHGVAIADIAAIDALSHLTAEQED